MFHDRVVVCESGDGVAVRSVCGIRVLLEDVQVRAAFCEDEIACNEELVVEVNVSLASECQVFGDRTNVAGAVGISVCHVDSVVFARSQDVKDAEYQTDDRCMTEIYRTDSRIS